MITTRFRPLAAAAALAAASLALTACAATEADVAATTAPAAEWPRTVDVAGAAVEIADEPQRIVALSTETGDLALELVGPDRMAAISSGSVTEGAGNQVELAQQVETVLETNTTPDPEQILALEPDLVLMTQRHDGEQAAADLLAGTGIPSLAFPTSSFQTLDGIMDAVDVLGEALGAEEAADEVVATMRERRQDLVEHAQEHAADAEHAPTVLLLMARGGQQMIQPATTLMSHLVSEVGGEVVGAGQGAAPADPERIAHVNPDLILVEDFRGAGLGPFQSLLSSPALAEVKAISNDQVHLVSGAIASDTAGTRAVDGLEEISDLLHHGDH
ncbi:ABC transporter substrate-binding protein [Microbacterium sp. Marseille-Q6965]|uniref:ABC transporter substrate-binding protein n=1 Tax=Microbacterium sp. Marseille-Q6965 TaxID=2965072 RepID=UPI0021B6F9B5|nr:ABC transporter substrate-binding protein [Microbacterium sp. Marseille-Q6965]